MCAQLPLYDNLPVPVPRMPREGTTIRAVAEKFREGKKLDHKDVIDSDGSWRLASMVCDLKKLHGWSIDSYKVNSRGTKVYFVNAIDRRDLGWT